MNRTDKFLENHSTTNDDREVQKELDKLKMEIQKYLEKRNQLKSSKKEDPERKEAYQFKTFE
jgi:hypothetical protein